MKIIPSLETERLRLRACTEDGVEASFVLLQDEEVNRFLPMFLLQTLEEAREYLRKECLRCNPTEGSCIYAICLKPGGLVIGYRKANSSYDWGYAIQRTYIGIRGL